MTKNIENQSCILIQFTEESNEEFVGLEEWIQDENLEEFFFDNLEKEPKIIKVKWPESFQKLEMKSYLNNPEKHEWLKNKIGSLRSRGTWINMIEKQKTNKKYGTYESERNKRKIYTKKNYDSEDEEKENEEDKIKRKKKIENQLINPTAVAKKKKTDFCKTLENTPENIQQTQWTDSTTISHLNSSTQFKNLNFGSKKFLSKPTSNVTMVNAEHPQSSCSTPITNIENLSTQTTTSTIQPASILSEPTLENTPENIQQTQWTDSTTISHLNSSTQFKNLNFGSKKFLSKPTSNVTMVNAEHPQSSCSTPITSIENLSTQTKNSSIQPALFYQNQYSEVAQFYPWDTAKSGLYKLKKQLPTITRFCQVEPVLSRPQLSSISRHENAELWTTKIHSSTGAQALIIGDERLALGLNPTYIFLSTTRGVLPTTENTQEVLFLMGKFENHVFLIASVLLTHHQQELINMAIQTLQQKYLTRPENILKISGSVDLVNAASPIFTNAEKKVSFYEINKFLIGTAIAEGIDVENNENQEILLKLACVSLLPPEHVGPGIMLIKSPLEGALLTLTHLYWNKYRSVLNEKSCYKDIDSFDDAAWLHCCKRQTLHNKRHEVIFWEYFHISLGITEDQHLEKMKIQERKRVVKTLPLRSCLNTKPRDSKSQKIQRLWTMYENKQVNLERFLFLAMQHANGFFKNLIYNKSAFLGPTFPIRVNEVPTVPVVEEPTVPVVVPVVPVAEEVTVPNVEEPTVPVVEEPTAVFVEEPTASVAHTAVVTRDENSDDESNSELESEEEDVDSEEDNEVYGKKAPTKLLSGFLSKTQQENLRSKSICSRPRC
ncbi:hypothetical protein HCN44_007720 [Aphidius gifuensis]|uniref:Uncharacterized protein n=1 Tax=Aphidius gifuensis TaxID=684658 RepID=A0A834XLK9_APHGI|nr:hypothetical protein HCN44_007720 [Aphidius gifuensis]